jgi:hypothetical protein
MLEAASVFLSELAPLPHLRDTIKAFDFGVCCVGGN